MKTILESFVPFNIFFQLSLEKKWRCDQFQSQDSPSRVYAPIDTEQLFRSRVLAVEIFPWQTRQIYIATNDAAEKFWQKEIAIRSAIKLPLLREGTERNSTSQRHSSSDFFFFLNYKATLSKIVGASTVVSNFENNCWKFILRKEGSQRRAFVDKKKGEYLGFPVTWKDKTRSRFSPFARLFFTRS